MADPKSNGNGANGASGAHGANGMNGTNGTNGAKPGRAARSGAVVETRVVSRAGARVVERVLVLSEKAAARLEIKGSVPPREQKAG